MPKGVKCISSIEKVVNYNQIINPHVYIGIFWESLFIIILGSLYNIVDVQVFANLHLLVCKLVPEWFNASTNATAA